MFYKLEEVEQFFFQKTLEPTETSVNLNEDYTKN